MQYTIVISENNVSIRGWDVGPLAIVERNVSYIVLKSKGRTENPGSRYSGLKHYYPGEIMVFHIISREGDTFLVEKVISWTTARQSRD